MKYNAETALAALHAPGARPYLIGQIGQTLDGKIATSTGKSLYINGSDALAHLHRLRASVDAVIVGVGTIIADDPRLTVRLSEGTSPVRVVLDPGARIPSDARCLRDGAAPTLLIHATGSYKYALPDGVEDLRLSQDGNGRIAPGDVIEALRARGMNRVLVEGGPTTLSVFLGDGRLDELHIMVAPKLFGGGRDGLTLPPIDALEEALTPQTQVSLFDDGDVLYACQFRTASA